MDGKYGYIWKTHRRDERDMGPPRKTIKMFGTVTRLYTVAPGTNLRD
jgi:hypothetical protein